MALSDIDVCSNGLVRLGARPINDFTTGDTGTICGSVYPFIKQTVLTSYPWRITMRKSPLLPRSVTGPETDFKYSYQLPTDRIASPRKVFNSKTTPAGKQPKFTAYEIQDDKLLSSAEQILVDYQVDVTEQAMPFYLIELLTLALMAEIAFAVTDQQNVAELNTIKAWGVPSDNRRGGQFKVAARLDSQSQPPPRTENFPLTAVRQGS